MPAARCHLCDAADLVAGLLAEDLENPLAAVRMAAQLAPNVADESTNVILCGVRDGADAVLDRLTQLEVALNEASREHVCPRLHGPVR